MVSVKMSRILVSGASGPIGRALLPSLEASGAEVVRLVHTDPTTNTSHNPGNGERIPWDTARPISPGTVSGFDAVIHLAGETIVGRWTEAKKAKIRDTRLVGTRNLAQALAQARERPEVFICSSAIGYYGHRGDELLKEESSPGDGFLAEVCRAWEAATDPASKAGIRTAQIRTGVVLAPNSSALGKMLP